LKYNTESDSEVYDDDNGEEQQEYHSNNNTTTKFTKRLVKLANNFSKHKDSLAFIKEESFEHTKRQFSSPLTYRGNNNPISNGTLDKLMGDLINETLWEKRYKAKLK
jgi:hypothetical protein